MSNRFKKRSIILNEGSRILSFEIQFMQMLTNALDNLLLHRAPERTLRRRQLVTTA